MSPRRLRPLVAGLVASVGLAVLAWFVTPFTPDQTRRAANAAAIQGDRAPAAAAQAGVQTPPAARRAALEPNLLHAARRGRLMPGSSHNDAPTPGMLGDQAASPQANREPREERMRGAGTFDGDLRNITTTGVARRRSRPEREEPVARPVPLPGTSTPVDTRGISPTGAPSLPAPSPTASFEGLDYATWGAGHPADPNGDVGPNHYIQVVNTSIGIYRKIDGVRLAAFTFDTLMAQGHFGNLCDTENFGDPIVVYDTFEDRWILSDFAFRIDASGNVVNPPGSFQCFAVSKSGDPVSGGWNFYSINTTGGLGDYPKLGVWPDGLYMSVNMFDYPAAGNFQNVRVYAFNKAQMYAGTPAIQVVSFDAPSDEFALLPANARLQTGTPPAGSPNYFATVWNFLNGVGVWKFHVDWNSISTSSFTGPFNVVTPDNWSQFTGSGAPTPANTLDTLYPRLMFQNQYSNIGGVESLWDSHTVGASGVSSAQAAVRYYQLDVSGGAVAANSTQAFTYSPDTAVHRYMVSSAVDRRGDLALGYTASNATLNPALRYAGRLVTDPPNSITYTETSLIEGTGSQSVTTRWGDYSAMTLDVDGCTFWYTNEYYGVTGGNDQTRIASFSFPECTPISSGTLQGTVRSSSTGTPPIPGAIVTLGSRTATTDAGGVYTFANLPVGTYPAARASFPGFVTQAVSSVVVSQSATTTLNFALVPAPASGCFVDTAQADFQAGVPANCDLTTSPGDVTLVNTPAIDQQNTSVTNSGFGFTNISWAGQTFTPAVSGQVTRVDLDLFCSGCTGTTPNLTVSLRATSGGVPAGADLAVATIPGFSSGSGGFFSATFASPAALTAGTRYAVIVRAASAPSAGTYAYVCSCAGSGAVNSNPYANGQLVASGNSGTTWTADTTSGGRDLGFKVLMTSGFVPSGTFVSSVKDANPAPGAVVAWSTFSWNAAVPAGTTLQFQAAASNSPSGPFTFVGPDGTAGTFFASGGSLAQFSGSRYLQYRAVLGTSSSGATPVVHDVTVCFTIGATALAISSLSPASVVAGSGAFPLTVSGTGFVSGSIVRLDGADRLTTFGTSSQITGAVLATDVAAPATHTITVVNPTGGGTSNGLTLTVTVPPGIINGTVRDLATNQTVANATIAIDPGGLTAVTDGSGLYTRSVVPGTYSATASATGYLSSTVTGLVVAASQVKTQDFLLAPQVTATYDTTLKAPKCGQAGASCDSGPVLLLGRDTLSSGGAEPNQPNTIYNSCPDGTAGVFHSDESNDRIVITTLDGSLLGPGKTVRIDATVFAYGTGASDHLDLYYAPDATNPVWTFLTTLSPPGGGTQTLSATYVLPAGSLQAVRAGFRYQGAAAICGVNSTFDDHDDLIFATTSGGAHTPSITSATTLEDTQSTSGLVVSRNASDGASVTHFKLSAITGGTLYKNDGVTPIANDTFITVAEGGAGLRLTPAANLFSPVTTFSVTAQAANDSVGTGLSGAATAPITVVPVADTPSVTGATTTEDVQTTSGLVVTRNPADGVEVTHARITGITNGTLFQADGTTPIANNAVITYAEANAGLRFTPAPNLFSPSSTFSIQVAGATDASGGGAGPAATATIAVAPVADAPGITPATTAEDTRTASGLVISRNPADGAEVTHFKITGITNGTLFKNNGTTVIANNTVITFAEGAAGLKFTPALNTFSPGTAFSFQVQSATSAAGTGLSAASTAAITVTPVADVPSITGATTLEDVQTASGLVISRNPVDGAEVTHFKITSLTNGTLFLNDGTTSVLNNAFITFAQGQAGLKFKPVANGYSPAKAFSFKVQGATSAAGTGLGAAATATITVTPVADPPVITAATTNENTQSSSGLVITRSSVDGAEVTFFKITGIAGGTLFKNDGTTAISDGAFITLAEGNAGLKFTPLPNTFGTATFMAQSAFDAGGTGLGAGTAASIKVNAVAHTPSVTNAATNQETQSTSGLVVSRNPLDGAEVPYFKISNITNGTLFLANGTTVIANNGFITVAQGNAGLRFTPVAGAFSPGTVFSFQVQGATSTAGAGLSAPATATITVAATANVPSVTGAATTEDTQTTSGLVVTRNPLDGAQVTHFKITGITNGTLFQNDGTTPIAGSSFITVAQGNAGLKFRPAANLFSPANTFSFKVQGSMSATGAGLSAAMATASITVTPVGDPPGVTSATTNEDRQSTTGLVITRSSVDGTSVTAFKITGITGGTLFKNDGTTQIPNGMFITLAEGAAGLKFTPFPNAFAGGSFTVQSALDATGAGLSAPKVVTIRVIAIADTPSVTDAATTAGIQTTAGLVVTRNAVDGAEVKYFKITNITNGALFLNNGTTPVANNTFITVAQGNAGLKFTPVAGATSADTVFSFEVQGATSNTGGGLGPATTATITVTAPLEASTAAVGSSDK